MPLPPPEPLPCKPQQQQQQQCRLLAQQSNRAPESPLPHIGIPFCAMEMWKSWATQNDGRGRRICTSVMSTFKYFLEPCSTAGALHHPPPSSPFWYISSLEFHTFRRSNGWDLSSFLNRHVLKRGVKTTTDGTERTEGGRLNARYTLSRPRRRTVPNGVLGVRSTVALRLRGHT